MATRLVCNDEAIIYLRAKVNSTIFGSVVLIIVKKSSSPNGTSQSEVSCDSSLKKIVASSFQ